MYCNNCGIEIGNEKTLCTKCEVNQTTSIKTDTENNSEINVEAKKITLIRHKSLGRIDISHLISEINISRLTMKLKQQKINFYIFKKKPIETIHNVKDFTSIKIGRTLDISDGIFALIFGLFGFVNPTFFLATAILLWVGFGRKIKIKLSNNAIILIPSDKTKPCLELLDELLKISPSIVVEKKYQ
jgi:hypothetical protein